MGSSPASSNVTDNAPASMSASSTRSASRLPKAIFSSSQLMRRFYGICRACTSGRACEPAHKEPLASGLTSKAPQEVPMPRQAHNSSDRKVNAVPKGYQSVIPYLAVRDGTAALDFYQKVFGAD